MIITLTYYYLEKHPTAKKIVLRETKGVDVGEKKNHTHREKCWYPSGVDNNNNNYYNNTFKPVLQTTRVKRPPALRDHCSDTRILLKAI